MTDWSQSDLFRKKAEQAERDSAPEREWRAFCYVGKYRVRAQVNGKRFKVERPCRYSPGKWRSGGYYSIEGFVAIVKQNQGPPGLTPQRAALVMVAFDEWVTKGCPRMTRPKDCTPEPTVESASAPRRSPGRE